MNRKEPRSKGAREPGQDESGREGLGDDMGTRVGRPDPGQGGPEEGTEGRTGMGGEANQGINGAQRGGERGASIERGTDERPPDRAGSEPLPGRQGEHESGYGGQGGTPRTSSDQREGGADHHGDEGTKGPKR